MVAQAAIPVRVIQGTPEWVDARRDVIGSSDVPIITGSSPYGTSLFTLWALKTRLAEPEPIDAETQELFDLGHALEPVIAGRYELATGRRVRRRRHLLVHPKHRWMGASLDRVSARRGERRIIEIKWLPYRRWATDGPEPVPAYVLDQVQWQLAVTGYDVADVAVLSGARVDVHEVEPDTAHQDDLRFVAEEFWGRVRRGERPAVDGSDSTTATIRRMYARDTLGVIEPTPEIDAVAYALRDAIGVAKAATEEDARLRNTMRMLLEEHAGVEGEDYRIHFRRSIDRIVTTTDWRSVADAYRRAIDALVHELPAAQAVLDRVGCQDPETVESLHSATEAVAGRRSLIPKFRDADTGRWV